MIHRLNAARALAFFLFACGQCATILGQSPEPAPLDRSKPGNLSRQKSSGEITLLARDANTHGVMMRYEPQTNKNCLGYWTNPADWASWDFEVSSPGQFEIEVWQGCGQGQGGSEVALEIAGKRFDFVVEETGHFQRFLPRKIGVINLPSAGKFALTLKPKRKQADAIMDIRQVRLIPVKTKKISMQLPGKKSDWFGFGREDVENNGEPTLAGPSKNERRWRPWTWHGEFFGRQPNPDPAPSDRGSHLVQKVAASWAENSL